MYNRVLVPVDNSECGWQAAEMAIKLGQCFGSLLVGFHVYTAQLHRIRLQQLNPVLPEKFQTPQERQRLDIIHQKLIDKGLELISDSYLEKFKKMAEKAGLTLEPKTAEGRNYVQILKELNHGDYDLVVLGAYGLGESKALGSVADRVLKGARKDVLIVRLPLKEGEIVVGVDGSPESLLAVERAALLARKLNLPVAAVAVFDPLLHPAAFAGLKEVLSGKGEKLFRLSSQETLHKEVIDQGLERLYSLYLEEAKAVASNNGLKIKTKVLKGRPADALLDYIQTSSPALIVLGRFGLHRTDGLPIGYTSEMVARFASTNVLVTVGKIEEEIVWTPEAEERLKNVPPFLRSMVRKAIEKYARSKGIKTITPEVMSQARQNIGF